MKSFLILGCMAFMAVAADVSHLSGNYLPPDQPLTQYSTSQNQYLPPVTPPTPKQYLPPYPPTTQKYLPPPPSSASPKHTYLPPSIVPHSSYITPARPIQNTYLSNPSPSSTLPKQYLSAKRGYRLPQQSSSASLQSSQTQSTKKYLSSQSSQKGYAPQSAGYSSQSAGYSPSLQTSQQMYMPSISSAQVPMLSYAPPKSVLKYLPTHYKIIRTRYRD